MLNKLIKIPKPLILDCKTLLFAAFFLNNVQVKSQDDPISFPPVINNMTITSNIQSPNTASLGTYGNIPVSLYTGTPDISVPIYQINEGSIPLDIYLAHDASGVRVNAVPGWVGQNWSLQAGGMIQRSVKGRCADEFDVTRGSNDYYAIKQSKYNNWGERGGSNASNVDGFWPWWFQGYKYHGPLLAASNWSTPQNFFNIYLASFYTNSRPMDSDPSWYSGSHDAVYQKNYQPDLEPDLFTFNFMGHTGRFFMGHDRQWKVVSSSNLKVICDFTQDVQTPATTTTTYSWTTLTTLREFPRIINKITMIDDKGNEFVFGYNDATELTFPDFSNQYDFPITSSAWYLKTVKDKFGNVIYEFEYEKGPYITHYYLQNNTLRIEDCGTWSSQHYASMGVSTSPFAATGQLILPVYLKKIKTRSGISIQANASVSNAMKYKKSDPVNYSHPTSNSGLVHPDYFYKRLPDFVTLNPDWNQTQTDYLSLLKWKKLDNITIKDSNAKNLLTVDFNYINQPDRRLFLTGITMNATKKYTFEYDQDNLLPGFLSSAFDHLGYYDGTNFTLPKNDLDVAFWNSYPNQRTTNPATIKYGSLKKIIYPTKGYSEFTYEPHKYSKEVNAQGTLITSSTEGTIGGLRIQKIVKNDGLGNNYVKEYQYTTGINSTVSSGNFIYKPVYSKFFMDFALLRGQAGFRVINAAVCDINQLIPMVNLFGNTIEYETVIEKESYFNTATNISNSAYNIYKYSNYSQFPDLAPINPTVPHYSFRQPKTDKSFERGKLLERSVYDANATLKEKTTLKYESNQDLKINAISITIVDDSYSCNGGFNLDFANERLMSGYNIYYTDKYLTEEKTESFTPSGKIDKVKRYAYKRFPDAAGTITNNGDLFKVSDFEQGFASDQKGVLTSYKYAFDFNNPINTLMTSQRQLQPIATKKELIQGNPGTATVLNVLSEEKIEYANDATTGNKVQPKYIFSSKKNNTPEKIATCDLYDDKGNINQYTVENGMTTSVIWGYNKSKIIARLENINYNSIPAATIANLQALSDADTDNCRDSSCKEQLLRTAMATLRNDFPDSIITTYTYDPQTEVTSITDARGNTIYYSYDASQRLKEVRDKDGNILSENQYEYKNN